MTINGLPLHPLVVHAAVVFTPLAGLAAVAYLVPKWRDHLRWPVLVLGVVAALAVWLAASTGDPLAHQVLSGNGNPALVRAVHHHEDLAGKLQVATWILAAVSVGIWWFHARPGRLHQALTVLLPLAGVAALVLCVLTGDAGAKAVWAAGS